MKEFATKYLAWYGKQSKGIKAVLCLLYDVPSMLWRIAVSAEKDDTLGIVGAVLMLIFLGFPMTIVDIITMLLQEKLYWLKDFGVENLTETLEKDETPAEEKAEENADDKAEAEKTEAEPELEEVEPKDGEVTE